MTYFVLQVFENEEERKGTEVVDLVALPVYQRRPRIDVSCYPFYCFDFLIALKNHLIFATGGSEGTKRINDALNHNLNLKTRM